MPSPLKERKKNKMEPLLKEMSNFFFRRKKYTTVDDTNIVKYVIENKLHGEIKGNKIWEDMEFIGVCISVFVLKKN